MTRRETVDRLTARLVPLYGEREARAIARNAIAELAGLPLSALLTDPGAELAAEGLAEAEAQLIAGKPLQYVVGHTEFCGHRFAVREGVLIPRPETEELVDRILRSERGSRRMLDVGTGSGCIAASLALALPEAEVFAADISDEALAVAAENFRTLDARVTLRKADALNGLAEVFPERFDVIVSNPPYVTTAEMETLDPSVRDYEPHLALWGGDDGLDFYRAIVRNFTPALNPGGWLCFEFGMGQDAAVCDLLRRAGYEIAELKKDTADITRAVLARKREEG